MADLQAQELWTEKYRPKSFDDVAGQKEILTRIKAFVKAGNLPHILFAGPAGVGKTTTALIIARELFGETWKDNFLELNASDDRGIDTIRIKVKDFARTKAMGTTLPRVIYLDECDSLTREAQQALRRTMETFSGNARFILSCNYSSKVIDPIQSRCAVFRFKPVDVQDLERVIEHVSKHEELHVSSDGKKALLAVSEGDVRRLVNVMQSCASLSKKLDEKVVYDVVAAARPKEIKEVLLFAHDGKFVEAKKKLLDVMLHHGLSGLDVIKQIQQEVWNLSIPDTLKVKMVGLCGDIEFRMVEGSDEFVQLEALLAGFVGLKS